MQWGSALAARLLDLAIKQRGIGSPECVIPHSNWDIYSGSDKRKNGGRSWAYGVP